MKQFSHISIEMTSHYITLQEEVKEIYSDMILSKDSKIDVLMVVSSITAITTLPRLSSILF